MKSLNITETRAALTRLPEELGQDRTLAVTKHGEPVLAILPWELFQAMAETLEVMADPQALATLRQALKGLDPADLSDWEAVKRDLDL